jgi:hypothetical protein
VTVGSVVLSLLLVVALLPWARQVRRLALIGLACAVGIIVWNLALNVANASALNVDSAILGLSVQDIGSAVLAFLATALALALGVSDQPKSHKLGAAALVA